MEKEEEEKEGKGCEDGSLLELVGHIKEVNGRLDDLHVAWLTGFRVVRLTYL